MLNAATMAQVVTIQAAMRGKLARTKAQKLKRARNCILKRVLKKVRRQRLMNTRAGIWQVMKERIVRVQRVWRRIKFHRRLMHEINNRIAFKRQERYRQEKERQ